MYCNVHDAQGGFGGFFRVGNRPNEGAGERTVCLWLEDGQIAFSFDRPPGDRNDRFAGGGLSFEVVRPFEELRLRYDGPLHLLDDPGALVNPGPALRASPRCHGAADLRVTGLAPPFGGEPDRPSEAPGEEFARGHYEQLVAVTGTVVVGDRRIDVAGFGLRDHSWGPRTWQAPWYYRWCTANFGADAGFGLSRIARRDADGVRGGFVWDEGRLLPCDDVRVATVWSDDDPPSPRQVRLTMRCGERTWQVDGEVLRTVPLRNRRAGPTSTQVTRIAEGFTRWVLADGRIGYGWAEYLDQLVDGRPVGLAE